MSKRHWRVTKFFEPWIPVIVLLLRIVLEELKHLKA